ncbi:MAG: radical SAM protein [Nitrospira sp.]|nr:radical SAM protein [Nitrospira sp.]
MSVAPNKICESVVDYLLLKVAARCNIACTYCYWFRDGTVYEKPKVMSRDTFDELARKLIKHVHTFGLKTFSILFHGGEPLLCKKSDLSAFCSSLRAEESNLGCHFRFNLTTNGLLIDEEWVNIFKRFDVGLTLSIDGPKQIHDAARIDFEGNGTFDEVIKAIEFLRKHGIEPGILSVCQPEADPQDVLTLVVDQLGFGGFDILFPDASHLDVPASIAHYYHRLFDLWFDKYDSKGVTVRILDNMLLGLFGGYSESESIGYGPIRRLTVLTDGGMETLDVLRVIGNGFTATKLNIHTHEVQDIERDPLWREVLNASLNLAPECNHCQYKTACGGGHIASRWSSERRFNNQSVYCQDIQKIFQHIWNRVRPDLYLAPTSKLLV